MQRVHVLATLAVLSLAGLAGAWLGAPDVDPPPVAIASGEPADSPRGEGLEVITVHVSGAVRLPGLVTLRAGDRVAQAIAAAGGALAFAELSSLNLAAAVDDGDQVIVPSKGTQTAGPMGASPDKGLVDINHGTAADLEALPGVGPVLAKRIFDYREAHGPFETAEDLLDVPGIGEGKLAALRDAMNLK